ncbi:YARHG domain-containing protein, partial [Mycobacterium tuberculosis]|nr:YARHG domain-containing protein [Mycobacterium tuberculosis]
MSMFQTHSGRIGAAVILATVTTAALPPTPVAAQNYWQMSCQQLWHERNSYYKARGYCFKTVSYTHL